MPTRHEELPLEGVQTYSVRNRASKVQVEQFGAQVRAGMTVGELFEAFPDLLAGKEFRTLVHRLEGAISAGREWIVMIGGHVVKTGTSPVIAPMVREKWISCLAMNGSASIHDVEIALYGRTSEAVEVGIVEGSFGMAEETAAFVNGAARRAREREEGFGEALGAALLEARAPHAQVSLLAAAAEAGIPATVHVSLGADIVHQHPSADGGAIGEASLRDFRILSARVAALEGGVVLNVGSAVVMPEVFLKALTVARNLGHRVEGFAAANFDMLRHYRPRVNVVERPTAGGGWGADFAGHHEIMLPLLAACLRERLEGGDRGRAG